MGNSVSSKDAVAGHHALAPSHPQAPLLPPIDWHRPWLQPYRHPHGEAAAQLIGAAGMPVCAALQKQADAQAAGAAHAEGLAPALPRFVPQSDLPPDDSYEAFIRRHQAVPTRDHVHDFFNGLVWLRFPRTKARLNAIQSAEIAQHGVQGRRGPVRDACTVFDENGAILLAPPPLRQALLARDWQRLFGTLRPLWQEAQCIVFGHALLEQLCLPRKPLCAHVLTLPLALAERPQACEPSVPLPALDEAVSHALCPAALASKPLTPLPVLGVPGWWPANTDPAFYADASVFRPKRGVEAAIAKSP